jgi:hypothetical protein
MLIERVNVRWNGEDENALFRFPRLPDEAEASHRCVESSQMDGVSGGHRHLKEKNS